MTHTAPFFSGFIFGHMHRALVSRNAWVRRCVLLALATLALAPSAHGQVSLATAIDLALAHSPKIRAAQADVLKARAALEQARDVYIPVVTVETGAGGDAFGYSANPGSLFTFNAQSLLFNFSQKDYIRAGHYGLNAAALALQDVRQSVIEDAALSFLALQHDQQRQAVLEQESDLAERLAVIVQDRVLAGRDNGIELTTAQLTGAQLRLAALRARDDTANDRDHLALAMGMAPESTLTAEGTVPPPPAIKAPEPGLDLAITPAVAAAYATASSKEEVARGDRRYLLRPQLSFGAQYNRYATFTNSFGTIENIHGSSIGPNEGAFGVDLSIPLFDKVHRAKAEESAADAVHARAQADDAQRTTLDGHLKLRHSIEVLNAQSNVAQLEQQLAQQQLDALTVQLNTASAAPGAPALSPKDEQTSRIAERQKYLAVLDAAYQLREAQIQLLRQTGQLEPWIRQSLQTASPPSLSVPLHP